VKRNVSKSWVAFFPPSDHLWSCMLMCSTICWYKCPLMMEVSPISPEGTWDKGYSVIEPEECFFLLFKKHLILYMLKHIKTKGSIIINVAPHLALYGCTTIATETRILPRRYALLTKIIYEVQYMAKRRYTLRSTISIPGPIEATTFYCFMLWTE